MNGAWEAPIRISTSRLARRGTRPKCWLARRASRLGVAARLGRHQARPGSARDLGWDADLDRADRVAGAVARQARLGRLCARRVGGAHGFRSALFGLSVQPQGDVGIPDAAEIQRLSRDADAIAAISPPWASVERAAVREQPSIATPRASFPGSLRADVMPSVDRPRKAPDNPTAWASNLARRAAEERFRRPLASPRRGFERSGEAWSNAAWAVDQSLRRSGMRTLVQAGSAHRRRRGTR